MNQSAPGEFCEDVLHWMQHCPCEFRLLRHRRDCRPGTKDERPRIVPASGRRLERGACRHPRVAGRRAAGASVCIAGGRAAILVDGTQTPGCFSRIWRRAAYLAMNSPRGSKTCPPDPPPASSARSPQRFFLHETQPEAVRREPEHARLFGHTRAPHELARQRRHVHRHRQKAAMTQPTTAAITNPPAHSAASGNRTRNLGGEVRQHPHRGIERWRTNSR